MARRAGITARIVALLVWLPSVGDAARFDFALDRVEVEQGPISFGDEFDDGLFGEPYVVAPGTVVREAGGLLLLTDADGATLADSEIPFFTDLVLVDPSGAWFDGLGAGRMDGRFRPDLPLPGSYYLVAAVAPQSGAEADLLFGSTADLDPSIDPPGCFGPEPHLVGFLSFQLGPGLSGCDRVASGSVAGPVILRLEFDDAINSARASYSLDGLQFVPGDFWDVPAAPIPLGVTPSSPLVLLAFAGVGAISGCGGDADCDHVPDGSDTCPQVSDPDQSDTDGDGVGDACQCGDVDRDGRGNVVDALRIGRGEIVAPDPGFARCDVDADEDCDAADALAVARGEIGSSPAEQRCLSYRSLCVSPVCGDGLCEADENGCGCPADCGAGACADCGPGAPECGDGRCELFCLPAESHERCPRDCGCGA